MDDPTTGSGRVTADPQALRRLRAGGYDIADELDAVAVRCDRALEQLSADVPRLAGFAPPGDGATIRVLTAAVRRVDGTLGVFADRLEQADAAAVLPPVDLAGLGARLGVRLDPTARAVTSAAPGTGPHARTATAGMGDPVDTTTGVLWRTDTDLVVPSAAGPIPLSRTHHTGARGGWFGAGWTSLFDVRVRTGAGDAHVVYEDGSLVPYLRTATGWLPAAGATTRLRDAGAGVVHADRSDGSTYVFGAGGWLVELHRPGRPAIRIHRDRTGAPLGLEVAGRRALAATVREGRIRTLVGAATVLHYTYDTGRLVRVSRPDRVVGYGWRHGRLVTVTRDGAPLLRTRYDATGRVARQVDAAGGRWAFTYADDVCTIIDPRGGRWIDVTRDGRLVSRTDPDGRVVDLVRDPDHRLVRVADDDGEITVTRDGARTEVRHADRDVLAITTAPRQVRLRTRHESTQIAFDDVGRPVRIDGRGSLRLRHGPHGLTDAEDDRGRRLEVTADPLGRPVRMRGPAADVTVGYVGDDPQPTAIRIRRAGGHLDLRRTRGVRVDRVEVGLAGRPAATLDLDRSGRVIATSTPDGRRWTWVPDVAGRWTHVTGPGGATTRWRTTPGRVLRTGPDGRADLRLDAQDRLSRAALPDGRRLRLERDRRGRIVMADLGAGPVAILWEGTLPVGVRGGGLDARLQVDEDGRIVGLEDPAGRATIGRLDDGRPTRIDRDGVDPLRLGWDGDIATAATIADVPMTLPGAAGPWTGPGGTVTARRDDDVLRLHLGDVAAIAIRIDDHGRVLDQTVTTADATVLHERVERDATGRVTRWTIDDHTARFERDATGALAVADLGDRRLRYVTDAAGRRRRWTAADGRRKRARHDRHGRLVAVDDTASRRELAYDPGGRVVRDGAWRFGWDAAGGLRVARGPDWTVRHDLDAAGRRVRTRFERGGRLVRDLRWVWDPTVTAPRLLAVRDAVSGRRTFVRYGPGGRPVALVDPADPASVQWLVTDHLGSVRTVLDADGTVVRRRRFGPFGEVLEDTAPALIEDPDAPLVDLGYLGAPVDPGTGHVHLGMRQYDPSLGRFCSPDPLQPPVGIPAHDPYVYARNQPTAFVDRDGCWPTFLESAARGIADTAGRVVRGVDDWWDRHEQTINSVAMIVGVAGAVAAVTLSGGVAAPALAGALAMTANTATVATSAVGLIGAVDGITEGDVFGAGASLAGVVLPFGGPVYRSVRAGTGLRQGLRDVWVRAVAAETASAGRAVAREALDPAALAQAEALGVVVGQAFCAVPGLVGPAVDCPGA